VKSKEIGMRRGRPGETEHRIGLFDRYRAQKGVLVALHLHDHVGPHFQYGDVQELGKILCDFEQKDERRKR